MRSSQFVPPVLSYPPSYYAIDDHSDDEGEEHKHCEEAKAVLKKYGFPAFHKAHIAIALDISGSMEQKNRFFSSNKIQELIDKAMGIAIELSPDANHSVTIFPFGRKAYSPIVVDEHRVKEAVPTILANNSYSDATNYADVVMTLREFYFGSSAPVNAPLQTDTPPVFCIFVTDGEPNLKTHEAKSQFEYSENNAIFFKFIGLKGQQKDLQFETLVNICKTEPGSIRNKHLIKLNDPRELTIQKLFYGYRTWAEEAYEHKILRHDPEFNLDIKNPDDLAEIEEQKIINATHGHDVDHGHSNRVISAIAGITVSHVAPVVGLSIIGATIAACVLPVPFLLALLLGSMLGGAMGWVAPRIYACINPPIRLEPHGEPPRRNDYPAGHDQSSAQILNHLNIVNHSSSNANSYQAHASQHYQPSPGHQFRGFHNRPSSTLSFQDNGRQGFPPAQNPNYRR